MKKTFITASLIFLSSCAMVETNVPIRSATQPIPYGDEIDDNYSSTIDFSEPTPYSAQKAIMPEEPKQQSMIDEVQSVKQTTQEVQPAEVSKTNFGAVGTYKIGNPYLIDGVSYYPHENFEYSEIGTASWYGPDFHGGKTSNGETFDENKLTAAHRTLPMPSLIRVTNLENGASIKVKVNDRGPYARDRILDLSSASADVLGIKEKGSARVKVEILKEESLKLKDIAMASGNTDIYSSDLKYVAISQPQTPIAQQSQPVEPITPTIKQEPTPAPVTPIPSTQSNTNDAGEYFVQVAAYSTYDKAEAMKAKLAPLGTVKIFKATVNGNTLYKVRLGEFSSRAEADTVQSRVNDSGVKGSRVILKEDGSFHWK